MAATITLDQTIAWVQPYLNWANLTIGNNGEPAMSAANLTLQTIHRLLANSNRLHKERS